MTIYRILDVPRVYALAQQILAWGADEAIDNLIKNIMMTMPAPDGPVLDVGCGPASWLARNGVHPVGLDLTFDYMRAFAATNPLAVVASAADVPFRSDSFGAVWSIGLLHHLDDTLLLNTLREAMRVCRPGGYVAILDAVKPESVYRRPLAAAIRSLDRGRFMRKEDELKRLLQQVAAWNMRRVTYAKTGLEMAVFTAVKPVA